MEKVTIIGDLKVGTIETIQESQAETINLSTRKGLINDTLISFIGVIYPDTIKKVLSLVQLQLPLPS